MAKNKADNKAVRANGEAALNCFPKTKLRNQLDKLAEARGTAESGATASDNVSLVIVEIAESYGDAAMKVTTDISTILSDWKANLASMTMEMAVAGHKFAKLTAAKDDKPATACLTGTGNNVLSIAKGVVDFGLAIALLPTDGETPVSYRDVRTAVQGLRKARKDAANPEAAALATAEQTCRDNFADLCEAVFSQKDIELTMSLATALAEQTAEQNAAVAAADAIEADAPESAEAETAALIAAAV